MIGRRFGLLVVQQRSTTKARHWECLCDCGNRTHAHASNLHRGATKSCGCLQACRRPEVATRHGMWGTPTYRSWLSARQRCENRCDGGFSHYGARGIAVCERWKSFSAFLEDMGVCPTGLTLDRIDVHGNYEPGNCRWASDEQQARNTTRTHYLTLNGVTKPMSEWAAESGLPARIVRARILRSGWDAQRALTTPIQPHWKAAA